jgi:plastocyanin
MKNLALLAIVVITMKSISFEPKSAKLKVGDSVEWVNKSFTEHSATSEDSPASFDTGLVESQKTSKKIVMGKAGTFKYHCSVHGKSMSGELVVNP